MSRRPILLPTALAALAAFGAGVARADMPARPALKVATLDGGTFDLAAQRGHWVIVNFWATWCSPCIKEMPDISAFVAAHANVAAIGLAYEDTDKAEVAAFARAHPVKYPLAQVDVYKLAEEVTAGLTGLEVPLRVAVMGCVVNGPGEAREADLGVASGNGKGQIFVKGKVIATVPESKIVETLIDEAMRLAEQALEDGASEAPGQPIVTVS